MSTMIDHGRVSGVTEPKLGEADLDRAESAPAELAHTDAPIASNIGIGSQARPARDGAITAASGSPREASIFSKLTRLVRNMTHAKVDRHVLPAWLADLEHDRATRDEMIAAMVGDGHAYDAQEDSMIQQRLAMLAANSAHSGELSKSSSLTDAVRIAYSRARQKAHTKYGPTVDSSWTKYDEATGQLVGRIELLIRGARPLDVIAYLMDVNGRHQQSRLNPKVDVCLETRQIRNVHHIISFFECKTAPFQNRIFLSAIMWKKLTDTQYVWCSSPIANHHSATSSDKSRAVCADLWRCIRLTIISARNTKLEYACTLDLKGRFPKWFTNRIALPALLALPFQLQEYFMQIRPIEDLSAEDGRFIGQMLMHVALKAPKAHRAKAVAKFVLRTAMLREAPLANLPTVLETMISKDCHNILAGDVATQGLAQLTASDAKTIGDGITTIRRRHFAPANAVEDIFNQYNVLRATAQQCPWFEPMLTVVITRLMDVSIGQKLRLAQSTVLSLLDVGTDLFAMLAYYVAGEMFTGSLILMAVCFSIAVQLLVVYYRNRHRSAGEITKELLIVLSFLKPVIDLRRLMTGHEVHGAPFNTSLERAICKVVETACESVLAAIIAMVALLLSEQWGWAPIVSIVISWVVTAHKATTLTFDLDTDSKNRKINPSFYGFIPASPARRRVVHACLFVCILAHVMERTIALALLFVTRKEWFGALLGIEMGVYLLYKALRSDLLAWVPGMGYGTSIVERLVVKVMLDFCGLAQLRFPCEAGGTCWLFSILTNQVVCAMSVWAYTEHYDGPGKLDRAVILPTVGTVVGVWAAAMIGFLLSIERTYLWTFISLETGRECVIRRFRELEGNDEQRILHIFNTNELLWESIRSEVQVWCQANYDRWKAESPAWLTSRLLAKIPADCLPKYHLQVLSEPALVRRHRGVRGLDGDLD
jgi:hypothetical protein